MNARHAVGEASRLSPLDRTLGTGWRPILFGLVLWLVPLVLSAQSYSIDWSTVDGGGGTSTGGVYAVNGTIGQPEAGAMSGGGYSLTGGFWALYALQTPEAPHLWVMRTPTNTVCVWWALSDTSWQFQATPNLAATGSIWTTYAYITNGPNCVYIESPPLENKFYGLRKP